MVAADPHAAWPGPPWAIVTVMETLAEDLLLLAVRPNGKLGAAPKLRFGLSGSELVRLAAARRVDIVRGRIVVLDAAPTGDDLLDAALQSMAGGRRQPTAKAWVARSRPGLVDRYLDRLAAAGVIRAEGRQVMGLFPGTRWVVVDTAAGSGAGEAGCHRVRLVAPGSLDSEQRRSPGWPGDRPVRADLSRLRRGRARKNLKKAATRDRSESPAAVPSPTRPPRPRRPRARPPRP